jgi:hypothetical protein
MGTGGTGVATFDFESVQQTVTVGSQSGMTGDQWEGRLLEPPAGAVVGARRQRRAMAALALAGAFASFSFAVTSYSTVSFFLESGLCQVVKQTGHHGSLFHLGSNLVGKRHHRLPSSNGCPLSQRRQPSNGASSCSMLGQREDNIPTHTTQVPCCRS